MHVCMYVRMYVCVYEYRVILLISCIYIYVYIYIYVKKYMYISNVSRKAATIPAHVSGRAGSHANAAVPLGGCVNRVGGTV